MLFFSHLWFSQNPVALLEQSTAYLWRKCSKCLPVKYCCNQKILALPAVSILTRHHDWPCLQNWRKKHFVSHTATGHTWQLTCCLSYSLSFSVELVIPVASSTVYLCCSGVFSVSSYVFHTACVPVGRTGWRAVVAACRSVGCGDLEAACHHRRE